MPREREARLSAPLSESLVPLSSSLPPLLENEIVPSPARYSAYYRDYLNHPVYQKYMHMHKMCLGEKGAGELEAVASELEQEDDPTFLSAAASAYLEAGIIHSADEPVERCTLADAAQLLWEKALVYEEWLEERELIAGSPDDIDDVSAPYRLATNLACMPAVRSMFEGNVTTEAIEQSLEELITIGGLVAEQTHFAKRQARYTEMNQYYGFSHEINTLVALMYRKDPRFIAIPSFHRAGAGYFYPEQTHDIELISQHYGTVRTILPIEVKSRVRQRNRRRYRSLLVSGRVDLQLSEWRDPNITRGAYARCLEGEPSAMDSYIVDSTQIAISGLLAHYKRTGRYKPLARRNSPTTYYRGDRNHIA